MYMYLVTYHIGIISDPADSLFTYDQSDSFQTYHHPDYVPLFEVSFTDLQLQQSAESKCEGDQLCLFDIAASGSVEVGVATLEQGKSVKSITETSQPGENDLDLWLINYYQLLNIDVHVM